MANETLIFLACSIYSILAEYSLDSCTFRWALWPMGLWFHDVAHILMAVLPLYISPWQIQRLQSGVFWKWMDVYMFNVFMYPRTFHNSSSFELAFKSITFRIYECQAESLSWVFFLKDTFMKYIYSYKLHVYELRHDKINKVSVRPAKTRSAWAFVQSDQSLCCLHEESLGPFLPIECTVKTLIRLAGCPGWSESSLGTHSLCWFCHVAAHMYLFCEEIHLNIWQF